MKKLFSLTVMIVLCLLLVGCGAECPHDNIVTDAAVPATCTEDGLTEGSHCSDCQAVITAQTVIPAGHRFVDGVCAICQALQTQTKGLAFKLNDDGTAYIVTGIGTATDTDIVIPSVYNGLPVTSIRDDAFAECMSLKSITIPSSVTSIGEWAFVACTSLESLTVETGNTTYHSAGNCIIETATNTLLAGCKNSIIPTDGSVTSIGEYAFYGCTNLQSITIPSSVTSIGEWAFNACMSLESLTVETGNTTYHSAGNCIIETATKTLVAGCKNSIIPTDGSVTNIGEDAFYNCRSLQSITIPSSVTSIGKGAFSDCVKLVEVCNASSINIQAGSRENGYIGEYALHIYTPDSGTSKLETTADGYTFYADGETVYLLGYTGSDTDITLPADYRGKGYSMYPCTFLSQINIVSVTIPNGITSIGEYAFYGCTSLQSITIPSSVTSIGEYAFSDCTRLQNITIPSSVTSIGENAFEDCTNLTSVTFAEDSQLTSIGEDAFYNCRSLQSITIPSRVTSIGERAFDSCTSLTSVTFAENSQLTRIDAKTFRGCTNLQSITIPSRVTSISSSAFYGCTSLESLTVETGNTTYHSAGNCIIRTATNTLDIGCKNSIIPTDGSVTSIDSYAFDGCTSLTSITIPNSVTSIGEYAFSDCTSLQSITIPSSVTSIGYGAFSGCTSLTSVTFAENSQLTSIGTRAFRGCTNLQSITIPSSVTSIGYGAFSGCTSLTSVTFADTDTWFRTTNSADWSNKTSGTQTDVTNPSTNAMYFTSTYSSYYWFYASTERLTYELSSDGTAYTVTGIGTVTNPDIVIPSVYNGLPVTVIGYQAFYGCTSLQSITIPGSVTNIHLSAFANCTGLTSITIPMSVRTIDEAFSGCTSLESLTVETGNTTYHSAGNCIIETAKNTLVAGCKNSIIPTDGSVTSIGVGAFDGHTGLTSITIPESVTSIGGFAAFRGCTSLQSITIPSSVTDLGERAFDSCTSLTSVTFAENSQLTRIGPYAFRGCTSLTSIAIPNSVRRIWYQSFSDCTSLTSVTFADTDTWYRADDYFDFVNETGGTQTDVTNPSTNAMYFTSTYSSYYWFYASTESLTYELSSDGTAYTVTGIGTVTDVDIVIPSVYNGLPVTSIGDYAFRDCVGMKSVTFAENSQLTSIGEWAFYGCESLQNVTMPSIVTNIGVGAFAGCTSLTSITVPNSVKSIGNSAFSGCNELINIIFVENSHLASIGARAFRDCRSLQSITIPSSVTSIGEDAFFVCTNLQSITIPSSVTSIGTCAFSYCESLESVTFAENSQLTSIGEWAFRGCTSLQSITIPSGVTSIGERAFCDCTSLTSVTFADTDTWYRTTSSADWSNKTGGTQTDVTNPSTNATYFALTYSSYYSSYYWYKE